MSVKFWIDEVDRTSLVEMKSVVITDSVPARTDTLNFSMLILSTNISARPKSGNSIRLEVNGVDEFAGEVASVQEQELVNANAYRYAITCTDWTRRMDRLLVVIQEMASQSAGSVLRQIVTQFAPEFAGDLTGIQEGVAAGEQQYDYSNVTAAFDSLAAASGYIWYVDPYKKIWFVPPQDYKSPLLGNVYDVDGDARLGAFTWEEDITQVKNRIYIKDALVADSDDRTDQYISDGVSSFFKLFQEPQDELTTTAVSHLPDGTTKNWNISLIEEPTAIYGEDGTAFLCILNWGLQFPLDVSTDKPFLSPGEVIDVTTTPMRDDVVYMVEDIESQRMMADRENVTWNVDGGGIYEFLASLQGARLASATAAEEYGNVLLKQMAWPVVRGSFITQHYPGWRAGQTFFLRSSKRDLYNIETFWKTGVREDIQMWVSTVTRTLLLVTGNLIENDFSYDTVGMSFPSEYSCVPTTEATPTERPTKTPVVKFTTTRSAAVLSDYVIGRLDGTRIPVESGVNYTFKGYFCATGGNPPIRLDIDWYDGSGNYLSTTSSSATAVSTSWVLKTATGNAPGTAETAILRIQMAKTSTITAYGNGLFFESTSESTHNMIMQTQVTFSNKAIEG